MDETPSELRARHPDHNVIELTLRDAPSSARQTLLKLPGVASVETVDTSFRLRPRNGVDLHLSVWEAARANQWHVLSLRRLPAPLDEVFHRLTLNESTARAS